VIRISCPSVATVIALVVGLLFASSVQAAEPNIWSADLKDAKHHLASARQRLSTATVDLATARAGEPAARHSRDRWSQVADQRWSRADAARIQADHARTATLAARTVARHRVDDVARRLAVRTDRWRHYRAAWIGSAWLILALSTALAVGVIATAIRRREPDDTTRASGRAATACAVTVGVSVAAFLASLLGALWASDANVFTPVLAVAAAAAALLPIGLALGWRRSARDTPNRHPAISIVLSLGGVCAVTGLMLLGLARARPMPDPLPTEVSALAAEANANAPLPSAVQADLDHVNVLRTYAVDATNNANLARDRLAALSSDAEKALALQRRARRAVSSWSNTVDERQAEYDSYQRLLDEQDALNADDPYTTDDGNGYDPSTDLPDLSDVDPTIPDTSGGTTEDFGNGSGSVGLCNDGTTSDSIGRPGACSHHSGVAG
jgi:hypothetical protein